MMDGRMNYIVWWLLLVLSNTELIKTSKLNVPRVLLPLFNQFSTNFTLEVTDNGCYKWSVSRLDLVQILPVDVDPIDGCSSKAIVTAISKEISRNTAIVLAEEVHSGQVFRCDIIVDVIKKLNIITTTRELFIEEAPEAFEVRAYDDQGNEFSTLEGVAFQWRLGAVGQYDAHTVLRFIRFKESPYKIPPAIEEFERQGVQGYTVLLEGLKTGTAKVSVSLDHDEYKHLETVEVQLTVVANLIIDPPDIYLLAGCLVKYRILQVQHGKMTEIPLPSPQYYMEIEDPSVATIDKSTGIAIAKDYGKTKVFLHDRNVDEVAGMRVPTASLTVARHSYLSLSILPHRNWAVIVNQNYEIVVEIYDKDNHKFHISEDVEVTTSIPGNYFQVEHSTSNGTHHFGFPVKVGTAPVEATLDAVRKQNKERIPLSPKVSAHAELVIYDKITLQPREIVLPWDPVTKPRYEVTVKASGGDGKFLWTSSNTAVGVVTQSGIVKTNARGSSSITAAMIRNQQNRESAKVYLLPVMDLEIVQYAMEAEIDAPIFLHVALFAERPDDKGSKRIPFTKCEDLEFGIRVSDTDFVYNSSLKASPAGIACTTIAIVGKILGTCEVTVSYTYQDLHVEDSVTVATYRKLISLHPVRGETVLAVGTSRHLAFAGGPRPWPSGFAEHSKSLDVENNTVVEVTELKALVKHKQDLYAFNVLCKRLGESYVTLQVTNNPTSKQCKLSQAYAIVKVYCAKPRFVQLKPELKIADGKSCPMNLNSQKIVAQSYKDVELTVVVKDSEGRKFDNITTLYLEWVFTPQTTLAVPVKQNSAIMEHSVENDIIIPGRTYQVIQTKGVTGMLEVTVEVIGYHNNLMSKDDGIEQEWPPFSVVGEDGKLRTPDIKYTLTIIFVNDTVISPNKTILYNHPSNKLYLEVSQGSGHYEFVLSSNEIADIHYVESSRMIEVIPKTDGILKLALVDLCLVSRPAVAEIQVIGVGSIHVDVPDKVERGRSIEAILHIYDSNGNVLSIPDLSLLDLRPILESNILSVKFDKTSGSGIRFLVTGVELGDTTLAFAAGRDTREMKSHSLPIQVFPPLRLYPRNITLVVGSVLQVTSRGGPHPDANIEYSIGSIAIGKISTTGIIEALKLGDTTVTGRAVSVNKVSGHKVIYSQDTVELHVVRLTGVKIHAPLARLKTGSTMPVYATGVLEQLSPLILGSCRPPLSFKWSLESRDVAVIRNVFYENGIDVPDEDKISMRLTALQPGVTVLRLTVAVPHTIAQTTSIEKVVYFHDQLEIEVFEELRLLQPSIENTRTILMTPNTELQLHTNRDGAGHMIYSVLGSNNNTIISVGRSGLLTSFSALGLAVVMITVYEDFGVRQTISATIEVKPIHYMMIHVHPLIKTREDEAVEELPKGLKTIFSVSYHDNTGKKFTAARTDLKLRTNRFDLAQFGRGPENSTLLSDLTHVGHTVLKVWDGQTFYISDFIKISVGEVITPSKITLNVGDVMCFSMPLQALEDHTGRWTTDNANIMTVDPMTGIGLVTHPGSVMVQYFLSPAISTNSEYEVLPIEQIVFLPAREQILINTNVESPYIVPLALVNDQDPTRRGNLISKNGSCNAEYIVRKFPFTCELAFSDSTSISASEVFSSFAKFNLAEGYYYCEIVPNSIPSPNVSTLQTDVFLTVTVPQSGMQPSVVSAPLRIPFVPSFYLHSPEIYITDSQPASALLVSGSTRVLSSIEVRPMDSMLLHVGSPDTSEENKYSYPVLLKEYFWSRGELSTQLSVAVISELTNQHVQVPVKIRFGGGKMSAVPCIANNIGSWGSPLGDLFFAHQNAAVIVASVIILFLSAWYAYTNFFGSPETTVYSVVSPQGTPQASPAVAAHLLHTPPHNFAPAYGEINPRFTSPNIRRDRHFP